MSNTLLGMWHIVSVVQLAVSWCELFTLILSEDHHGSWLSRCLLVWQNMHDGTEHSLVCWALPSAHHHQHITMPRVLLVGSSHMVGVVKHLEENPPPFAIYPAAKGGLRADQGLDFLKQHGAIFRWWLKENFQVQVFYSELLPHAVWEGKPRELSAQKWA